MKKANKNTAVSDTKIPTRKLDVKGIADLSRSGTIGNTSGLSLDIEDRIIKICHGIKIVLLEKNKRYGDSAANPANVFSDLKAEAGIRVRIDDKIKRITTSTKDGKKPSKNDVFDLIGYLILYASSRDWLDFEGLLD